MSRQFILSKVLINDLRIFRLKRMIKCSSAVSFFALIFWVACGEEQAGPGGFSMPPTAVEIATAQVQNVADRFEAVGSIEAFESITVVAEIDAQVARLPFREGSTVRRGTLIAQLDGSQLSAELARARAELAQKQSAYDRIKKIVDQGAGAPQDLDDAAANLKVAEANLAFQQARFAKTKIVAPFNGIIGARKVSVGAFLRPGEAIAELANIDSIRVNFSAPERFLGQLKQGAEVAVSTTAFPGYELSGKILVIEPILDSATRSARIVAGVANPGRKFRAGMSANVSAVMGARPQAITIPSEAVFASGDESLVFVVNEDSTVSRTAVQLGTRTSDFVEITEGLEPGADVVRAGHQKLFQGAKVMPVQSKQAGTH